MRTIEEIEGLDAWRALRPIGREYIKNAVTSPPSRTVGLGGLVNQSGVFCSATAGHTLQWESRSVELVFVHHMEIDSQVQGIWEQLPRLAARAAPEFIDQDADEGKSAKTRFDWRADFKDEVLERLLALNSERVAAERSAGSIACAEEADKVDSEDGEGFSLTEE